MKLTAALGTGLAGFSVLMLGTPESPEPRPAPEPQRPNIIFLLSDDQRDNTFSGMGHPFVQTPNFDALLEQSVRFSNTYIAEPVCAPSRVSFLTGQHERIHGIGFTSSYKLTEDQWSQTYPALLKGAGYYTGFVGKFGVEYYTFFGEASTKFDYWWGHDGWTKFLPKDVITPSTRPYHRAKNDIITPIMSEGMTEFLEGVPHDKPFCLSVSFNVPHGSQTTSMFMDYPEWRTMSRPANENPDLKGTEFYDKLYRDVDIEIPEETAGDPYRFIPKTALDQDKGRSRTYSYDYTRQTTEEHYIRYYQTISGLDHEIGSLMKDLDRLGLAENTVIIFASDHGLLMGEYGMGGKALLYDLASKIPCFVYDPRLPSDQRGKVRQELVSSLDVTSTILDYAGVKQPGGMDGLSLRPLVEDDDFSWRDELFLESLFTGRGTPFQEGVRRGKWKYVRMFPSEGRYLEDDLDFEGKDPIFEMLFNLESDPGEKNNLIESEGLAGLLDEMRKSCAAKSSSLNQRRKAFIRDRSVRRR